MRRIVRLDPESVLRVMPVAMPAEGAPKIEGAPLRKLRQRTIRTSAFHEGTAFAAE
jgi:hypothetical protein